MRESDALQGRAARRVGGYSRAAQHSKAPTHVPAKQPTKQPAPPNSHPGWTTWALVAARAIALNSSSVPFPVISSRTPERSPTQASSERTLS